jgi:hypothetical protein
LGEPKIGTEAKVDDGMGVGVVVASRGFGVNLDCRGYDLQRKVGTAALFLTETKKSSIVGPECLKLGVER